VRAVLDTSVLIGPLRRPLDGEVAVSAVSLAELHFGVLVAKTGESRSTRLRRVAAIERAFKPLPVDDAVARAYGKLAAATVSAGRKVRPRALDLLIAATAHVHDARLYTRNAADLAAVDDLVDIVAVPEATGDDADHALVIEGIDDRVLEVLRFSAASNDRSVSEEIVAVVTAALERSSTPDR
jgi:predicted nucleic acid-binding protein